MKFYNCQPKPIDRYKDRVKTRELLRINQRAMKRFLAETVKHSQEIGSNSN